MLTAAGALNAVAWMQAHAMTAYVDSGKRTDRPESLSLFGKAKIILTGVQLPRPENTKAPDSVGLSYETYKVSISDGSYLETWFVPAKTINSAVSKGIVLMFPPYGGSKQSLLSSGRVFYELGYDTLLVDYRGVGGSSGSDTTLGVREGEDVAIALNYVKANWAERPTILYGASLGAASVLRAVAHDGAKPTAVILESPFDRLLGTVRHRFEAMGLPAFPSAELIVWWGGQQQGINGFAHNPVMYAEAITCPVLLMYGEADTRVTLAEVSTIYEALPEQKEFVLFSSIGHGALAVDDPEKWRSHVESFLQTL